MLDSKSIEDIIRDNIQQSVDHYVTAVIGHDQWTQEIENRIVRHVQDRITAKFSNISSVPELTETVKSCVANLMTDTYIPGLDQYIDHEKLRQSVDSSIEVMITKVIDELAANPEWLSKIENRINQNMIARFGEKLSMVDVDALMGQHIDAGIDRWQQRLRENFQTVGITDQASQQQLVIMDDGVVMMSGLAAPEIIIERDARIDGTLSVQNLAVRGSINVDNHSWRELGSNIADMALTKMTAEWQQNLVREILDLARGQGIDFAEITVMGKSLVSGNTLSPHVTRTSIEKTGVLESLRVAGDTDLADTVSVRRQRVGINTDSPEMALSVWDEEVAVIMGKLGRQQAYLGTARLQNLSIGVNRVPQIDIDTDGLTTIKKLRVGQHRMAFERQVPGYSGTRGDIVFNSDPKDGQPWAWQCLGGFQWRPLKVA